MKNITTREHGEANKANRIYLNSPPKFLEFTGLFKPFFSKKDLKLENHYYYVEISTEMEGVLLN